MDISEAKSIRRNFERTDDPSEEEIFLYTEAMDYLIHETKQPRYMMGLGSYYYEQKRFDLALKYYDMAAEWGDPDADVCLGYIWYYGRTGERDFEKAFHYYSKGETGQKTLALRPFAFYIHISRMMRFYRTPRFCAGKGESNDGI